MSYEYGYIIKAGSETGREVLGTVDSSGYEAKGKEIDSANFVSNKQRDKNTTWFIEKLPMTDDKQTENGDNIENKAQVDALVIPPSCVEGYELEPQTYLERISLAMSHAGVGWFEALNECDNVHILGDCPLCGAV